MDSVISQAIKDLLEQPLTSDPALDDVLELDTQWDYSWDDPLWTSEESWSTLPPSPEPQILYEILQPGTERHRRFSAERQLGAMITEVPLAPPVYKPQLALPAPPIRLAICAAPLPIHGSAGSSSRTSAAKEKRRRNRGDRRANHQRQRRQRRAAEQSGVRSKAISDPVHNITKGLHWRAACKKHGNTPVLPFFGGYKGYPFSNHSRVPVFIDGRKFPDNEHAYLFRKLAHFRAGELMHLITNISPPINLKREVKFKLCRLLARRAAKEGERGVSIKLDQEDTWDRKKFDSMLFINQQKFLQNPKVTKALLDTEAKFLVEASPTDSFWGAMMGLDHPEMQLGPTSSAFRGENRMGQILMTVRDQLHSEWGFTSANYDPNDRRSYQIAMARRSYGPH